LAGNGKNYFYQNKIIMHRSLLLALITLFIFSCQSKPTTEKKDTPAYPKEGFVSSAHPLATQAGLEILQKGGNAFDAAVAVAAALNVVEPMMSGMGGYGTILVYDAANKKVRFLDSSGKIPFNMNSDLMRPPTPDYLENRRGAKSVSTPGNVNAWDAMSSAYGQLEWRQLFDPAIQLAKEGFPVSERLAFWIDRAFQDFPEHAQRIFGKNGAPIKEGEILLQTDLAHSFQQLQEKGRAYFYEGELAQIIAATMKEKGSFLALEDLQKDQAEWWEPIQINYKGFDVFTASPPANSFPALIRLGMMEQLADKQLEHNSTEYLHYYAEVTKHAFWCRLRYAGDPEVAPPPLDSLLSEAYLKEQTAAIDPNQASVFSPPEYAAPEGRNTTHFVVADRQGNIVSATQTLGNLFGSKIMPEGTGIWFNNSLAYCTYEPKGNPMDAIPGQRKLSGDCPVIIFKDQRPVYALGTPGGHTIPQTVPQMIMNLIDFGMNIDEAIQAPRISFVEPNIIAVENGVSNKVFKDMENLGHEVERTRALGNAHGISLKYENGQFAGFEGGADKRGEGSAEGF
jgi:gamma-glutamyltranspeptidase/glutathione hydrolase